MAYEDAYSYSRYGAKEWQKAIDCLAAQGYTEAQIECIMRSKYTRWAADQAQGKPKAKDLLGWIDNQSTQSINSLFFDEGLPRKSIPS